MVLKTEIQIKVMQMVMLMETVTKEILMVQITVIKIVEMQMVMPMVMLTLVTKMVFQTVI